MNIFVWPSFEETFLIDEHCIGIEEYRMSFGFKCQHQLLRILFNLHIRQVYFLDFKLFHV